MSVEGLNWAAKQPLTGTDKAVLLALGWFADKETGSSFPGQRAIADWCGASERSVRDALARLDADGWVLREARRGKDGYRTSDRYRLRQGTVPTAESKAAATRAARHQPANLAARPTGESRRLDLTGEIRPSHRRDSPGREELRSSFEPTGNRQKRAVRADPIPAAPKPKAKAASRGTRIPDDWTLSDKGREYAAARVAWQTPEALAEHFKNYWQAASGRTAVKIDWDAAYRTWVNQAVTHGPPRGWTPPPVQVAPATPADAYEARLRAWCARLGIVWAEYLDNVGEPGWLELQASESGIPVPTR